MGHPVTIRSLAHLAALTIVACSLAGCGAAIVAHLDAVALDDSPEHLFPTGTPRSDVEPTLGAPEASRTLPDGSRLDTYMYVVRDPEWRKLKWTMAVGSVITVGFAEAVFVPVGAYSALSHRRTAIMLYGDDDRVLGHGPPPAYGPPDDALAALGFDAIRQRCRAEQSADAPGRAGPEATASAYEVCVAYRLAIWGVE